MRVFKAVAELGGFTAAASALSATQPFVSRTIKSLEQRLGITLLRRSTRHLRLTPEGEDFLASANKILGDLDAMEASLSSGRSELSGEIRLTAPTNFGVDQIAPLLPGFFARHPRIRINLALTDTVVDVLDGGFDIAIRMGRLQDSMLLSRKLAPLQRIVVASPVYVRQHGEPACPGDLASHNCLRWDAPLEHLNHWPFVVDGKKVSIPVSGNFQAGSGVAVAIMCTGHVGISRMAEHLALPLIRRGELVPLLTPYQPVDDAGIYAVFVRERFVHPRIRAFVDYLVESFEVPPWTEAAFHAAGI
jgi:DNA-binding transcriptional LysR family regulator